jgi:hypothetical protein
MCSISFDQSRLQLLCQLMVDHAELNQALLYIIYSQFPSHLQQTVLANDIFQ